jgi:hypothetical protein
MLTVSEEVKGATRKIVDRTPEETELMRQLEELVCTKLGLEKLTVNNLQCNRAMQSIGGSSRLNLTAIASFENIPVAIASARCRPMSPVLLSLLNGLRCDHSVELLG